MFRVLLSDWQAKFSKEEDQPRLQSVLQMQIQDDGHLMINIHKACGIQARYCKWNPVKELT